VGAAAAASRLVAGRPLWAVCDDSRGRYLADAAPHPMAAKSPNYLMLHLAPMSVAQNRDEKRVKTRYSIAKGLWRKLLLGFWQAWRT